MEETILKILKEERGADWRDETRKSIKTKERTQMSRVKMPEADPERRSHSYEEVNQGLTEEQALAEARRCIDCPEPTCVSGCPVGIHIPKFIKHIERGEFLDAAVALKETNTLPAVCGRVCPQELQCEANCFYTIKLKKPAVAIGYLERFAADYERNSGKTAIPEITAKRSEKIAVIGSGPAGLACAADLVKEGYDVTVFEALHELGGVLKYGIPNFRLPNEIVETEIRNLEKMGIKFKTNFIFGRTVTFDDMRKEGYKAFFVGSGAGLPNFMNIPGENFNGIYSCNEYLTRVNLMSAAHEDFDTPVRFGKNIAVIGGGNTAMDAVRTARRLGAERSMIIYRRSEDQMPARVEEIKHAKEEGVEFMLLTSPLEYFADENGFVKQMKLQKMELGEPDASGRRRPQPIEGSEYMVDTDMVIVSVGVSPNPLIPAVLPDLEATKWGTIVVDKETMQSSIEDVFAGGDIVRGGATVILAMGDGRAAAAGIHKYIQEKVAAN